MFQNHLRERCWYRASQLGLSARVLDASPQSQRGWSFRTFQHPGLCHSYSLEAKEKWVLQTLGCLRDLGPCLHFINKEAETERGHLLFFMSHGCEVKQPVFKEGTPNPVLRRLLGCWLLQGLELPGPSYHSKESVFRTG